VTATETQSAEPPAGKRRGRAIGAWTALVLAGFLLLVSSFAVWVNRVALNTDVFVDTSSELLDDDAIRSAVATRAVDELYAEVDVASLLEDRLPNDYQSLSGPAAAGLRQASYQIVNRALEQPSMQKLWAISLEESHRTLVQVLEGGGDRVSTDEGIVTLDLRPIVLDTAERIGLRNEVADRLPADAGRIEVLRSDELDTAQNVFQLLKTLAWLLPILAIGAFALAVWLAGDRRRALRRIGITTVVVGVLGLVAVRIAGSYVVNELVADTETRTAADNAWDILTELLRSSFRWLVVIGALFLVAAWLASPGRRAIATRRLLAPAVRERAWAYTGLGVVALILLLTGAVNDFTRLLVVVALVALGALWIERTREQTLQEFPDASAPELFGDARSRVSGWWDARRAERAARPVTAPPTSGGAPAGTDVVKRLAGLADLHAQGALTDEEFASAKARVLAGD
jgi:Short C-terminal domain